jgi:pimeloyl-ACP methyl ester carboxylesterase
VDGDGVEADGARLAYQERGEGEPVLLLLLHPGFVADGMLPLVDAAELAGFRLISYHRRGYGASSRVSASISLARQAADAATLLDRLGAGRAHLVGHSFGANVALELAAGDPDRVGALVLMEALLGFALDPGDGGVRRGGGGRGGAPVRRRGPCRGTRRVARPGVRLRLPGRADELPPRRVDDGRNRRAGGVRR